MQKTVGPCTILMCFTVGLEVTDTLMGTTLSMLCSFHWPCWLHTYMPPECNTVWPATRVPC